MVELEKKVDDNLSEQIESLKREIARLTEETRLMASEATNNSYKKTIELMLEMEKRVDQR